MDKSEAQAEFERNTPVARDLIYQGKTITLHADSLNPEGSHPRRWDVVAHPGAVVIVPVTKDAKILLVKQWRRVVGKILLELPAGTLEEGEHVVDCAHRELREETGFKANELISLGGFYSAPGYCTEYLHLFAAFELEEAPLQPDADEEIDLIAVTLEDAWEWIKNNQICDAKTIAGIARYEKFYAR